MSWHLSWRIAEDSVQCLIKIMKIHVGSRLDSKLRENQEQRWLEIQDKNWSKTLDWTRYSRHDLDMSHLIGTENDQNWYDVLRNDQIITSDHIFAKNIKRGYSLTLLHHRIRNTLHQYDNWKRFFSLKFSILIFPGDFRLHGLFKTSLI